MNRKYLKFLMLRMLGKISYILPGFAARLACRVFLTPPKFKQPTKEIKFLVTATQRIRLFGCALWGWGQSQKKIILIHGWAGRGAQMRYFVEPLIQLGYEVWLMDAPGHGQSDKTPTNMARFAEKLALISQQWGGTYAVIGHSLGGSAAIVANSLGASIKNVVLIGSPSVIEEVFEMFARRVGLGPRSKKLFYQEVQSKVGMPPEAVSPLLLAPRSTARGLLLHDPDDREVAFQHALELSNVWPKAELKRVLRVGHYRILKSPQAIALVQDFLGPANIDD